MASTSRLQADMFAEVQDKVLFDRARDYAYAYLDGLYQRDVVPSDAAVRNLEVFDEPFPAAPGDGKRILRLLHEYGSPATVTQAGGRYFGFVNGSSIPAAVAARWLSDVWDQNTALSVMSPLASQLESICERWLVDLFDLPAGTAAGLVGGTSIGTLCGLAAARNELLARQGWDASADGLFGAPHLRVIVGAQAHATVHKALALLGLGRARVETVPADDQGRMLADSLPPLDERCLVIAQAGNVNSGAFDPFEPICERAGRARAWVHVDGAFGLWAAGSKRARRLVQGAALADSWSVDAHKTLNAPYDCGIVLCRHRAALVAAMQATASYIPAAGQRDGMHYTPDMSRRARSVELWATLKALGRAGIEDLVDRLCDHAAAFAHGLRARGFRLLNDVVFNQVLVACDTPQETRLVLSRVQRSGVCWCGGATWNGEPVIRVSVCSWATTSDDVDRSVAAFEHARRAAAGDRCNPERP